MTSQVDPVEEQQLGLWQVLSERTRRCRWSGVGQMGGQPDASDAATGLCDRIKGEDEKD